MDPRPIRLAVVIAACSWAVPAHSYQWDPDTRTVTIAPQASALATTREVNAVAQRLRDRPDQGSTWTWKFSGGRYPLTASLYRPGLKNVKLVSDPANPAVLSKDGAWRDADNEFIVDLRYCAGIGLSGFEFRGKTEDFPTKPNWQDQGVNFASCDTVAVDGNKFFDIGNAALRVETMQGDPVKGVNSFRTTITRNLFDNIYQISTTSNDKEHGGTASLRMAGNVIRHLHGSVKFATRTPGARDIAIVDNLIDGSAHYGLEIVNYEKVEVRGNTLRDIASVAINIYTDGDAARLAHGFPWGSDFTIADNTVRDAGLGLSYRHDPFWDGTQNVPSRLVIENNTFDRIARRSLADPDWPAIHLAGGPIDGVRIASNRFHDLANGRALSPVPAQSTHVVLTPGNTTPATLPVRDLEGRLRSALVWQQPATGKLQAWPAPTGWSEGAFAVPAGWTVAALVDLDGDRRADAVLRHPVTGQVAVLLATRPTVPAPVATLDPAWQIAASGDIDGDGRTDLVWRRADDTAAIVWFMNGAVVQSRATFGMDPAWQLIAAADFDGDGHADLLWRQAGTANTAVWLMNGAAVKARLSLSLDATAYMVGTGDFDGDGRADILMRNPGTGLITLVFGAATGQPRAESQAGMDPFSWRIGAIGDFDGDGRADIAWRHVSSDQVTVWTMAGASVTRSQAITGADGSWQMVR